MSGPASPNASPHRSPNVRKRAATRERIADASVALVGAEGLTGATVDRIAEAAGVGRATFFRYFSSKEDAVAEGMTRHWLRLITTALAAAPPELSATEAVLAAFEDMAAGFSGIADQIRDLATLTRSSPALGAWTLQVYVRYENAIAGLIAPRIAGLGAGDPRPRLIGALAMAAVRVSLDDWLVHGGDLPRRVHTALAAISVTGA
ncbi:TetR family transcriptional regulator [Mycolicibacterium palauense]|uniref:TetR family transcriptional regulator n=1 Tax=Mycolicibacterium palauense TaxID=2034511 RepID=UPI000BFF0D71|nr:TetR family transcriptional regulator [Mycolicibacterium palauense]